MAITFTPDPGKPMQLVGTIRQASGIITGDASYPTNGYAVTPQTFGLTSISSMEIEEASTGHRPLWDRSATAPKIKMFWCAGAGAPDTEVTNATSLTTAISRITVYGF